MYQGRQAASAHAAGDHYGSRQTAVSPLPGAGRRRRIGLAPVPESARAAREFTVATLRKWQLDALIEDAVVIASELATNAIRHGTPAATRDATNDSTVQCHAGIQSVSAGRDAFSSSELRQFESI